MGVLPVFTQNSYFSKSSFQKIKILPLMFVKLHFGKFNDYLFKYNLYNLYNTLDFNIYYSLYIYMTRIIIIQ